MQKSNISHLTAIASIAKSILIHNGMSMGICNRGIINRPSAYADRDFIYRESLNQTAITHNDEGDCDGEFRFTGR